MIDIEELRNIFRYDNGKLFWKIRPSNNMKDGTEAGCLDSDGYIIIRRKGKNYKAHRIIYALHHNKWPTLIDHINGNKSDNRIENLREASYYINVHNSHKTWGEVPYRGVHYNKLQRKFIALKMINGKSRILGRFDSPEEAANAYREAHNHAL